MITEQMTKSEFVVEVLNRDVENIYRAQLLIAEKNIRLQGSSLKSVKRRGEKIGTGSGKLLEALRDPHYSIAGVNGKFQVQAYIPLQSRFLDMRHLHKNNSFFICILIVLLLSLRCQTITD